MRLRNSQEMGSGRAEEVVAALADELGLATAAAAREEETPQTETPKDEQGPAEARVLTPEAQDAVAPVVEMVRPVRERLWLAEELALRDAEGRPTAPSRLPSRV
jgi:hypothetical protein